MNRRHVLAGAALAIPMLSQMAKAALADASSYHVIIQAGQSNRHEYGAGSWTDTDNSNDYRILQIGRSPHLHHANLAVVPAVRPLDYWPPFGSLLHGGGLSQARWYAANYLPSGASLIVVPAACSGTSILVWNKVVADKQGRPLWDDMITRIDTALSLPNAAPVIFNWWQMEADVALAKHNGDPWHPLMPDAAAYVAQETTLHANMRAHIGTVPIVRSMMTDAYLPGDATKDSFTAAVTAFGATVPLYGITDTAGLLANSEIPGGDPSATVHFCADAQETIAYRDIVQTYAGLIA